MQVFVTSRAERNFEAIVGYIKSKWGDRAAKHFVEKTDHTLKLLKSYPSMGQIEKGEIRGFQLSPQTRLLYRITNENIIVLAFFDIRQNPDKRFE